MRICSSLVLFPVPIHLPRMINNIVNILKGNLICLAQSDCHWSITYLRALWYEYECISFICRSFICSLWRRIAKVETEWEDMVRFALLESLNWKCNISFWLLPLNSFLFSVILNEWQTKQRACFSFSNQMAISSNENTFFQCIFTLLNVICANSQLDCMVIKYVFNCLTHKKVTENVRTINIFLWNSNVRSTYLHMFIVFFFFFLNIHLFKLAEEFSLKTLQIEMHCECDADSRLILLTEQ